MWITSVHLNIVPQVSSSTSMCLYRAQKYVSTIFSNCQLFEKILSQFFLPLLNACLSGKLGKISKWKFFSHQKWHLKELGVATATIGYTYIEIIVVIQLRLFHIAWNIWMFVTVSNADLNMLYIQYIDTFKCVHWQRIRMQLYMDNFCILFYAIFIFTNHVCVCFSV